MPAVRRLVTDGAIRLEEAAEERVVLRKDDPAELHAIVNCMAAALIACGIDPEVRLLFNHDLVPAIPEMALILSCTVFGTSR